MAYLCHKCNKVVYELGELQSDDVCECYSEFRIRAENAERRVERLTDIIREFCAGQEFADKAWKKQKHIKTLFDEAGQM